MTFPAELELYVKMADAAFLGFAALAIVGGIVAVGARQLIHAVLGLFPSLAGVAALYVYLGNQFIAAMQILIYIGAVSISMSFAVMLARPPQDAQAKPLRSAVKITTGALVGLGAAYVVGRAVVAHAWKEAPEVTNPGAIADIGAGLLTRHVLVFELISLVLLVAIAGSVVVAGRGRGAAGSPGDKQ